MMLYVKLYVVAILRCLKLYVAAKIFAPNMIIIPINALLLIDSLRIKFAKILVNTTLRKSNVAIKLIFPLLKHHINNIFAQSNIIVMAPRKLMVVKFIIWGFINI